MPKNQKLDTPMVEKIKIEREEGESMTSMIVGTVLVALGILLFVIGVVMFVLYYLPPREDRNVNKPVLTELPTTTNSVKLNIKGESEYEKVMVWVNDELVNGGVEVKDNKFEYEYQVSKEGNYSVEVAALKGFPIRLRSEKTNPMAVAIDWTAPSKNVTFKYSKEVDTKRFAVKGKAEANTVVTVKSGNKEYIGKVNDKGEFEIKNIPLKVGDNSFTASIADAAGNSARIDTNINVVYALGDINGGGVTDLPESAGLFENQGIYNLGNTLISFFGLMSMLVLGVNLYLVKRKLNS